MSPRPTSQASQAWARRPIKKRRPPRPKLTVAEQLSGKTVEELDAIQAQLREDFRRRAKGNGK